MAKIIRDLTTGSVPKTLLRFSLPLFMSGLLQMVYNMVDMIVVGRFVGTRGLSAVSIGGEVLMLRHNIALPRPYSRANLVQGTRAIYSEDCKGVHIDGVHEHEVWEEMEKIYRKYDHPLWQNYTPDSDAGHGGMDFLVLDAFADAARNRTEPPIDVYDTAAWMAITPLSEQSVAMGGAPQPFPDFTRGKWTQGRKVCGGKYCLDTEDVFF